MNILDALKELEEKVGKPIPKKVNAKIIDDWKSLEEKKPASGLPDAKKTL